jgi:hypothetical protein
MYKKKVLTMNDFYMILASNGAPKMYPDNTSYHFYSPLPNPLQLTGKWRVSLQEITYQNSIQTIVDEKIRVYTRPPAITRLEKMEDINDINKKGKFFDLIKILDDEKYQLEIKRAAVKSGGYEYPLKYVRVEGTDVKRKELEITKDESGLIVEALEPGYKYELWGIKTRYPADKIELITLKPGYYSTEEKLCSELNQLLHGRASFEMENVDAEKYFLLKTLADNTRLELMNGLHYILGYGKTLLDREVFRAMKTSDLARGSFVMFIYCNIVDTSMVGNVEAPLLRTVHIQKTERGSTVNHLFNPGFHIRVNKTYINEIEVDIRTDSGEAFPFAKDGKTILTLHFERENDTPVALLPPPVYYDNQKMYIQ